MIGLSCILAPNSTSYTLPTGETVEVAGRRTPLFNLARELDAQGYGGYRLQAYAPAGTPSLRGLVSVMAQLIVTERDNRGLRLEKFRRFPVRGRAVERDAGPPGTQHVPAVSSVVVVAV